MITFDKKAQAEDFIVFFWFALLVIIVVGGIAGGIFLFFSEEYDFRKIDSILLNKKIEFCLLQNELNWAVLPQENGTDFYEICNIAQESINQNFLIVIEKNGNEVLTNGKGDTNQCKLADKNPNFPKCTISVLQKNSDTFKIIAGSNQHSKEKIT